MTFLWKAVIEACLLKAEPAFKPHSGATGQDTAYHGDDKSNGTPGRDSSIRA